MNWALKNKDEKVGRLPLRKFSKNCILCLDKQNKKNDKKIIHFQDIEKQITELQQKIENEGQEQTMIRKKISEGEAEVCL